MIVELRQYTLHPGKRDVLIELFEREFIEPQEAAGMHILGTFRDLDDPDRFVWLRGFADMESRREALQTFYGGPVWKAHRDAANATMIDSDDVLLLRLLRPFPEQLSDVFIYPFDEALLPHAVLRTEQVENTFPRLPVRNDNVVVAFEPLSRTPLQHLRLEPTSRRSFTPPPPTHPHPGA